MQEWQRIVMKKIEVQVKRIAQHPDERSEVADNRMTIIEELIDVFEKCKSTTFFERQQISIRFKKLSALLPEQGTFNQKTAKRYCEEMIKKC